jgi:RHS repeat-associated protein
MDTRRRAVSWAALITRATTIRWARPRALSGAFLALLLASAAPAAADNEIGRLTSGGNGFMRRHYEYDALGRVRREVHVLDHASFAYLTAFGYPSGSPGGPGSVPASLTLPDSETVSYGYDADGQLDTITAGGQPVVKGIARNARGQTVDVVYGNDARTIRRYNEGGDLRLNLIKSCFGPISGDGCQASGTPFQAYTYVYDANGNVRAATDQVIQGTYSSSYEYDSLDQLVSRTSAGGTSTYGYDEVGNLVAKEGLGQSYGAGVCGDGRRGPHALALSGGDCYSYDGNGNVVATTSGLTLTWNSEGMATRVAKGGVSYEKHFLGASLWKKTEGSLTTYYLPSMRKEGTQTRKFYGVFAERSAEDGQLRFYHPDQLGSSTVLTAAGGVVAHRSAFKPYGEDVDAGGGAFVPKLRFNFKEKESTGLYDYGARLYNPATGRWLSADPLLADGLNRYAYVRNNPLRYVDPTGHAGQEWEGLFVHVTVEDLALDPLGRRSANPLARVDVRRYVPPATPEIRQIFERSLIAALKGAGFVFPAAKWAAEDLEGRPSSNGEKALDVALAVTPYLGKVPGVRTALQIGAGWSRATLRAVASKAGLGNAGVGGLQAMAKEGLLRLVEFADPVWNLGRNTRVIEFAARLRIPFAIAKEQGDITLTEVLTLVHNRDYYILYDKAKNLATLMPGRGKGPVVVVQ